MPLDTTLLDLDCALTILDIRAFFKKHDWSAARISEPKSRSSKDNKTISYVQSIMDETVEKEARARGLAALIGIFSPFVIMNFIVRFMIHRQRYNSDIKTTGA